MTRSPNILLIVSDEERRNDWLDGVVDLPAHRRLRRDGVDFERYYTHSSPCSPSRASLFAGRYLAQHGVVDNVSFPAHVALDPGTATIGGLLRDAGYESGYVGKWHLSHSAQPDLAGYGYSGWEGVKGPGVASGQSTQALATHVDLAATIAELGGLEPDGLHTLSGTSLKPVLSNPASSVRDHVLFAQDSAQSELLRHSRYALRGFFDGETKYARYYGVGGGIDRSPPPIRRCSASTLLSTITTTSGTPPRKIRTSCATWPTTVAAEHSCERTSNGSSPMKRTNSRRSHDDLMRVVMEDGVLQAFEHGGPQRHGPLG